MVKVAICLFIIVAGAFFVKAATQPVRPGGHGPRPVRRLGQPLVQAVFGLPPAAFGIGGILTAAAVVFFAYSGFEAVANLSARRPSKPSRDLPLGLFGTLVIATVLYIGVSLVVTGMVDYGQLDEGSPLASSVRPGRAPAGPAPWSRSPRSAG